MKKVNFKRISIKNFLSYGPEPFVLEFKKGIHIITGVNRDKSDRQNGLGKSALIESLYFAIFGSTIRELKKDLIPNSYTKGDCEVILDFEVISENCKDSYKITRTINPSKLYLYKNGEDVTRDSIKNTEEYIHSTINASPSIFENCVIMTLNNTIPFMAKSKIDKRKFIEGIFNLDIFSKMLSDVREKYNDKKREYEIELTKMENSEKNLNSLISQKERIVNERSNKIGVYEQRKVDNNIEKEKLLKELSKQESDDVSKIKDDINNIKKVRTSFSDQIDILNKKCSEIKANVAHCKLQMTKIGVKGSSCPVCLRSVAEHDKEYIKEEKNKMQSQIDAGDEQISKLEKEIEETKSNRNKIELALDKWNKKLQQIAVNEQKKKSVKDRIKQLDQWLSQLDGDIEELKSKHTDVDPFIQETITSYEALKESVNKYRFDMNIMETVKFIVSEEGVKSYIVKKILLLFNDRIRHYLTRLDANCICNFNEYFEEEIVNEKNKSFSYFNFSGAEKKNIDFACLFTFMDMRRLQGDVTYNISFYDELFDSCLDQKGIENVTKIIKDRVDKYDECVLIVTHRKENIKESGGEVIFLEKKDGITKRLDYNPFE
jgi:DNA repair exonuclease SbcCD ATPase subunit